MMYRPYFNTVTMVGDPSVIDFAINETTVDPDAGLFETLIGRNLNIDDEYTHNVSMYGTTHDVVIGTTQVFTRHDLDKWTFGFRTRMMPVEFLSGLARRFRCAVLYHVESCAETDAWFHLYITFNRHGHATYTGQTPPDSMADLPVYQSTQSEKHHERISND